MGLPTDGGGERAQAHRSGSELFICFTSRPSSSSSSCAAVAAMRVPSSKSLMSPGRNRDPSAAPPSLSASLSRRLRSSGSIKGAQSPMFPAAGGSRKKGCAFEAVEPSSPKVTCIGQVRVKTKKKSEGNAVTRSRSQRGEGSFTRIERNEHRNQRWVHQLPLSICEALRSLGSEFNCFVPCGGGRSPCSSNSSRGGEEKGGERGEKRPSNTSSCGAVFARWLMAIQEGEEGKRGEVVGLVVGEREQREVGLVIGEREKREVKGVEKKEEVEEEEGVCIPPRNALLLMRCGSDPVRVAALSNRFWGSAAPKAQVGGEEEEDGDSDDADEEREEEDDHDHTEVEEEDDGDGEDLEEDEAAQQFSAETEEVEKEATKAESSSERGEVTALAIEEREGEEEEEMQQQQSDEEKQEGYKEEEGILKEGLPAMALAVHRNPPKEEEEEEETHMQEKAEEKEKKDEIQSLERGEKKEVKERKGRRSSICSSKENEMRRHSFSTERDARRSSSSSMDRDGRTRRRWSFSIEKEEARLEEAAMIDSEAAEGEKKKGERSMEVKEEVRETEKEEKSTVAEEATQVVAGRGREGGRRELPDCLLLMMYEPKLSMEVSRETWVCTTDFHQWRPHQPRYDHRLPLHPSSSSKGPAKLEDGDDKGGENKGLTAAAEENLLPAPPPLPPLPPQPSIVTVVEQKLLRAAAVAAAPPPPPYEPFALTRCKSEPMRSSARLAPDACFWNSGHGPIGAAGIGF